VLLPRLDAAIAAAEQAVVKRDARLREGWRQLDLLVQTRRERLRHWGRVAAIGGAAVVAGIAALHGRRRRSARAAAGAGPHDQPRRAPSHLGSMLWSALGTLLTPVLAAWGAGQRWMPPGLMPLLLHGLALRRSRATQAGAAAQGRHTAPQAAARATGRPP
jgi:hypothetical protein